MRTVLGIESSCDETAAALVRECVEEARRTDMLAWLYDEDRWPSGFGGGMVTSNPEFRARVQKDLSGRMMIIVGKNDDFELFAPAERFANELSQLGIQTRFVATKHGHAGHLERFEPTLRFLLEKLDSAK